MRNLFILIFLIFSLNSHADKLDDFYKYTKGRTTSFGIQHRMKDLANKKVQLPLIGSEIEIKQINQRIYLFIGHPTIHFTVEISRKAAIMLDESIMSTDSFTIIPILISSVKQGDDRFLISATYGL